MSSEARCPVCTLSFDEDGREPRIIPGCGHTVCYFCLIEILAGKTDSKFICPLCKKSSKLTHRNLEDFPKNYAVSELTTERRRLGQESDYCRFHDSKIEMICLDCREKVCIKCAFKGAHKGHEIDHLDNLNTKTERYMNELKHWIKDIEKVLNPLKESISIRRRTLEQGIQQKFRKLHEALDVKKVEFMKEIQTHYENILSDEVFLTLQEAKKKLAIFQKGEEDRQQVGIDIESSLWLNKVEYVNQEMQAEQLSVMKNYNDLAFDFPFEPIELLITKNQIPPSPTDLNFTIDSDTNELILIKGECDGFANTRYLFQDKLKQVQKITLDLDSQTIGEGQLKGVPTFIYGPQNLQGLDLRFNKIRFEKGPSEQNRITKSNSKKSQNNLFTPIFKAISCRSKMQSLKIELANCSFVHETEFIEMVDSFFGLAQLNTLHLDCRKCSQLTEKSINALAKSLHNLTKINSLSLLLENIADFKDLTKLWNKENNQPQNINNNSPLLETFSPQISQFNTSTPSQSQIMAQQCSPYSKELICDPSSDKDSFTAAFVHLFQGIRLMKNLNYLSLSLVACNIGYQQMNQLVKLLQNSKQSSGLQHLSLNFDYNLLIDDHCIKQLSESFSIANNITELLLSFRDLSEITEASVYDIAVGVADLKKLQTLSLNLGDCFISDNSIQILAESISHVANLEFLNISSSNCAISDKGILALSQALVMMLGMKKLSLILPNSKRVTNHGLNEMARSIGLLMNLNYLNVNFSGWGVIDDNSTQTLFQSVGDLKGLKKCIIKFNECKKLGDKTLWAASKFLPRLLNLNEMQIEMNYGQNITDNGVIFLTNGLARITQLQEIGLSFKCCNRITDKSIISLSEMVNQNRVIKRMGIDLAECEKITMEGIEQLKKTFMILSKKHKN